MKSEHTMRRALQACALACVFLTAAATADEPAKGSVDPKAVALMAKVEAKLRAAKTIEAVRRSTVRDSSGNGNGWRVLKVQAQRPNKYRVETLEMSEGVRERFMTKVRVTDGQTRLTERLDKDGKPARHVEHTVEEDTYVWDDDMQTLAGLYFTDDELPGIGHDWRARKLKENTFRWIRMLPPEQWNGRQYQVVEWGYDVGYYLPEDQVRYRQKLYVSADNLVYRVVTNTSKGVVLEDEFRSLKLDPVLDASLFEVPSTGKQVELKPVYRSKFKVGDTLPDFSLKTPTGEPISLSKSLEGQKGGFVWLWGFRCGSCHVEYPMMQQMYDELKSEKITVIGLAGHSPVEALRTLQQTHRSTLPVAVVENAKDPNSVYGQYGSGWKTFYVVDANRRIVYIGNYNVKKFRAAINELGGKWPEKSSQVSAD